MTYDNVTGCVCVASRPSLVVICLKKFRKEFVVLEGRGPGARDKTKVRVGAARLCSLLAPPRLQRWSRLRHKYFSVSHSSYFFSSMILSLDTFSLKFKNNSINFFPLKRTEMVSAFWILFQISFHSIKREWRIPIFKSNILITIYRFEKEHTFHHNLRPGK